MMLVIILGLVAGFVYYLVHIGAIACCEARRRRAERRQNGKEFIEHAEERAGDRAQRWKDWAEGRAEEGIDGLRSKKDDSNAAISDGFSKAGKWIQKQEDQGTTEFSKFGQKVQAWAKDTGKGFKDFMENTQDKVCEILDNILRLSRTV